MKNMTSVALKKEIIIDILRAKNIIQQIHICECGKVYSHRASLFNHQKKCNYQQQQQQPEQQQQTPKEDNKDNIINLLVADNKEMIYMFLMFIKNHAEGQEDMTKKIIQEVLPLIGNDHHNTTTNSHNNTLNFYLTNTCKDAESITDFTSRFCDFI